ncbi:uncharacterized protein DS421_16g544020 [Arachis hypogaea]|nr:uncharacterized protein DS421_16g544010 [Arachis hypogaea]QHN86202.1 uncharacterized protein DS421_16g544020 [Arachis hypogaea]
MGSVGLRSSTYPTSRDMLMIIVCIYFNRCDHTSTNAPDPIRTSQLSVLGCDHAGTIAPDPIRTPQLGVLGQE